MNIRSRFRIQSDDFRTSKAKPSAKEVASSGAKGAAVGAGLGAAIGAGVGYAKGLANMEAQEITVTDTTYYSRQPHLVGAEYDDTDMVYEYDFFAEEYRWKTDDDDWDAIVQHSDDKAYQKPQFQSSHTGVLGAVATNALKGAVIGGVVGTLGATAARVAGWNDQSAEMLSTKTPKYAGVGLATGAVIGAGAGYYAGVVSQNNAITEIRTAPVYENQTIGWIPLERNARQISKDLGKGSGDYTLDYNELNGRYGSTPFEGQDSVVAKVPVGEVQKEFTSNRLSPVTGALAGMAIGGLIGTAVGTIASVAEHALSKN